MTCRPGSGIPDKDLNIRPETLERKAYLLTLGEFEVMNFLVGGMNTHDDSTTGPAAE